LRWTQDKLTNRLAEVYEASPELRGSVRVALVAVGRGGQGDVGQRIRDEILQVQSRNDCKVGFSVS
jgi:alpha-glucan,water dikinase